LKLSFTTRERTDGKTNPNRLKTATGIKSGENPNPIHLVRPPVKPLSAMAELGREIFFDTRLSSSEARPVTAYTNETAVSLV
jgi:cytochrome c peroxidase